MLKFSYIPSQTLVDCIRSSSTSNKLLQLFKHQPLAYPVVLFIYISSCQRFRYRDKLEAGFGKHYFKSGVVVPDTNNLPTPKYSVKLES